MSLYESVRNSLKESGSILDPAFTVCYNRLSIFPTRKSAIDFYKECMYGSEGSERERYTNIYLDLLDGSDVGLDDIDGDDTVWEIRWEDETGRNVAAQKLDGHKSANEIIKKIKSGKIMPPKEFLDVIDADTPKIEEGQKLKEAERKRESAWSDDGRSLNIRELVARILEEDYPELCNDKEIDLIYDALFGHVTDFEYSFNELLERCVKELAEKRKNGKLPTYEEVYGNRNNDLKENDRYFPGGEEQYFCRDCGLSFDEDQLTGCDDDGNDLCPACGSADIVDTGTEEELDEAERKAFKRYKGGE